MAVAVRVFRLGGSASGVVLQDEGSGGCIIRPERREARNCHRFIISRVLAHVLLYQRIIDWTPGRIRINLLYRSSEGEDADQAAHRLAGGIIMPSGRSGPES